MLEVGAKAPEFSLLNQDGKKISLKDSLGKKVVLYFYPKDNTPGCTKEACSFRDNFTRFNKIDAAILGVSPDPVKSHKKFAEKYKLNFDLLADDEKKVVQLYGVWKEKSMFGRKYMGVERTTFIIDENGRIKNIFKKVKVIGHAKEVIEALKD
ncbi:MAG: thioredoxin-dependent thiol peroxidase [Ignavibacterium sp.]|jgi:peroxiredoxin Q/BCP|nr:thioredoxin-dependent thiol peroxidase [Ignavibacterium sp.]